LTPPPAGPPARVRIVCRNENGEILLLKWRDPIDAHVFWEPPGGGIEPGEKPEEAAVRELYEETGFQTALGEESLIVERDYVFAGHRNHHIERFFLTTVAGEPAPAEFSEQEIATFLEARFVHPNELTELDAPLEPPHLASLIAELIPVE
jgi:8-oxo-dGTP diphosphatase